VASVRCTSTDTHADESPAPGDNNDDDGFPFKSFWADKFKIPNFKRDPWRWNKEWENILRTLSSSKDVYPKMATLYRKDRWDSTELAEHLTSLKNVVCGIQNMLPQVDEMDADEHFVTAWQLLEEEEGKRHLLKELERACRHESWGQDSRVLCPEITITSLLKQRGLAFIDLINIYKTGKKDVDGVLRIAFRTSGG
jgi:hypothetical protein